MSKGQKFLKFLAICLAFGIIFVMMSAIFSCVSFFSFLFTSNSIYEVSNGKTITEPIYELEVYVGEADLEIRKGNSLYVETDSENVEIIANKGVLSVKEVRRPFSVGFESKNVVIYIPEDLYFSDVEIETGTGRISIKDILTSNFELELGAGEITMKNVDVTQKTTIHGGAGAVNAENCRFTDLDMELGTGNSKLEASILGDSDIECGVGNTEISLLKEPAQYTISVDKGIGEVLVDGVNAADDDVFGSGTNILDVTCGVGKVTIDNSNDEFEE